ncbi:hypothetical protein Noda2021_10200 [Candidatus Dependentiae bacterium Noda2021]|nr:hypothetical protein Noda2021_10200 [Candidatus Dependentiae bacterium Noda2021]
MKINLKLLVVVACFVLPINASVIHSYLFAHGLGASSQQAHDYAVSPFNNQWIIKQPLFLFDFPDAANQNFNPAFTSLGQGDEINVIADAYKKTKTVSDKIILLGLSRGAAAMINFLGSHQPSNIAAAIFESPFDSITGLIQRKLSRNYMWWIPQSIAKRAPELIFKKYRAHECAPCDAIMHIPKDIPLLFVCSLKDTLIDAQGTCNLYCALKNAGYNNIYLLLLNEGAHAQLKWQNDRDWYVHTVHAFYDKYALPCEKNFAQKGAAVLEQCQPSVEVVQKALQTGKSYITG